MENIYFWKSGSFFFRCYFRYKSYIYPTTTCGTSSWLSLLTETLRSTNIRNSLRNKYFPKTFLLTQIVCSLRCRYIQKKSFLDFFWRKIKLTRHESIGVWQNALYDPLTPTLTLNKIKKDIEKNLISRRMNFQVVDEFPGGRWISRW